MIKYIKTELLNIAYLEQGEDNRRVVLLLHGWPDDATTWEKVMPELTSVGYRVIAPWLRGFGHTSFLNGNSRRTGNSGILTLDAVALMDNLGIGKFSVAGHDWGSNIAEALAAGWPERVEKMAQLSSPPRLGGAPTPPFKHAQLEWYHWFMAAKRGAEAVKKDPTGFARMMWDNWAPKGWYDEATFSIVSESWKNPDFVAVTLHSYRARWDEAEPDPNSADLENKLNLPKRFLCPPCTYRVRLMA